MHHLWKLSNRRGQRTWHFHSPSPSHSLDVFTLSRFLRKSLSLCQDDELTVQTWTEQMLSKNCCGTFRSLKQSPVKSHYKKSLISKRVNWNEPRASEESNFPALGSVWYCFFIVALEKVLFSVKSCLLPSCINHPGISLSVWMHFFSKLSDKCGCKMMATEKGYAWKCQSHSHKETGLLGIPFIWIPIQGDFQTSNVK